MQGIMTTGIMREIMSPPKTSILHKRSKLADSKVLRIQTGRESVSCGEKSLA